MKPILPSRPNHSWLRRRLRDAMWGVLWIRAQVNGRRAAWSSGQANSRAVESHIVPRPFSYASRLALAAVLAASGAAIATVEPLPGASPQTGRLGASYPVALAVMVRDA